MMYGCMDGWMDWMDGYDMDWNDVCIYIYGIWYMVIVAMAHPFM